MSADASRFVIPPPPQAALAIAGSDQLFPVRRIWCVGRNYLEHIKEMGQDEREPPFFFSKPADAIVADGGNVPYPPLTKDMHHEVELVVALKSGGRNIPLDKALDCIYGYGVGIDLTRRDLQIASRDMKRPWEIGKAFDASAPCGPLRPASEIGHPSKGRIALKVNGNSGGTGIITSAAKGPRGTTGLALAASGSNGADAIHAASDKGSGDNRR